MHGTIGGLRADTMRPVELEGTKFEMIYEKKSKPKRVTIFNSAIVFLFLILVIELAYLVFPSKEGFWDFKFIDAVNVFAQLATAGAFFLGVHQFKKSSNAERQSALVNEADSLIERMIKVIHKIGIGGESDPVNLHECIVNLTNLGCDFYEVFQELSEDIRKGIVRMHWQNMYFNELLPRLSKIDTASFLRQVSVGSVAPRFVLLAARQTVSGRSVMPAFFEYCVMLEVLKDSGIRSECLKLDLVTSARHFSTYFFDERYIRDLLLGIISIIDARSISPHIASFVDLAVRENR